MADFDVEPGVDEIGAGWPGAGEPGGAGGRPADVGELCGGDAMIHPVVSETLDGEVAVMLLAMRAGAGVGLDTSWAPCEPVADDDDACEYAAVENALAAILGDPAKRGRQGCR